MPPPTPPCGTNGGYQVHKRRGEEACQPCKDAKADWQYQYRKANPVVRSYDLRQDRAYNAAERRLRSRYPRLFERLYAEELARVGLR